MNFESIFDRLKKIEALALSGVDGERENAARLLNELCAKYGVSREQLADVREDMCEFKYSGDLEKRLLQNVIWHVVRNPDFDSFRLGRKQAIFVKVTRVQEVDIRDCFRHYSEVLKRHLRDVMTAFIHANAIYGDVSPSEAKPMDPDEVERILALLRATEADKWKKTFGLNASRGLALEA